jgi:hypothetical protein
MAIELKEALTLIKSGVWIKSIRCFTADLTKNNGGKIIEYKNVRIARRELISRRKGGITTGITGKNKNANHNENFTLNLEMKNQQLRKIHPILIFEINNQPVI